MNENILSVNPANPDERLAILLSGIKKQKNKNLKVPVFQGNENFMNADISALELSVRSYNAMMRHGYHTVGNLVRSIEGRGSLKAMRCVGDGSADEIMEKLLRFQYSVLSNENREKYLRRIEELNK